MKPQHIALGAAVAALWGFNFVVIRWGLHSYPPLLLAALRFAVAALGVFALPKPELSWRWLVMVGMVWFTFQFGLLFVGMQVGMPAGLASVLMQTQSILTVLFAAVFLGERISASQMSGMIVALLGLTLIGFTITGSPHDMTIGGLACILAAATCWAIGNILVKRSGQVDMLAFVTWLCLVPPLPLFALSLIYETPSVVWSSLAHPQWSGLAAVLFLAFAATTAGYGAWSYLIKLYGAANVSPFALLVPIFGALSAWAILDEPVSLIRLIGMAVVVGGIGIVVIASTRKSGRKSGARKMRPVAGDAELNPVSDSTTLSASEACRVSTAPRSELADPI
jgi:O-acetylserine/cysteine efflux transporter